MNHFEKLWQEYLRLEHGEMLLPPEQLAALRNAFFTGAWCQMAFSRKILGMGEAVAADVMRELQNELVSAVSAPPITLRAPLRETHQLAA